MEVFETVLTGTDGPIDGLVSTTSPDGIQQYQFLSFDETLTLIIGKDESGNWKRISSSEPYLSGWIEELGSQVDLHKSPTY